VHRDLATLSTLQTFIKPPYLVQLTMEGVCILLQVSGSIGGGSEGRPQKADVCCVPPCRAQEKTVDWDAAKRVLGDATFISRLIEVCRRLKACGGTCLSSLSSACHTAVALAPPIARARPAFKLSLSYVGCWLCPIPHPDCSMTRTPSLRGCGTS
jgi:hypothetical protein